MLCASLRIGPGLLATLALIAPTIWAQGQAGSKENTQPVMAGDERNDDAGLLENDVESREPAVAEAVVQRSLGRGRRRTHAEYDRGHGSAVGETGNVHARFDGKNPAVEVVER